MPGLTTRPLTPKSRVPPSLGRPSSRNQSAPFRTMAGTLASVSTLLMTVGRPNRPTDGRERRLEPGMAALPFERFEEGRLFAADIGPAPRWTWTSRRKPAPRMFCPEEARLARLRRCASSSRRATVSYSPRI